MGGFPELHEPSINKHVYRHRFRSIAFEWMSRPLWYPFLCSAVPLGFLSIFLHTDPTLSRVSMLQLLSIVAAAMLLLMPVPVKESSAKGAMFSGLAW